MNDNSTEEHDSSLVALRSKVIPLEYFNRPELKI